MEKLPIEFKEKWIKALLSGKYEQGKGCLKTAYNKYCCLGVAAEIQGVDITPETDGYITRSDAEGKIPDILISDTDLATKFVHMNDSENKSFAEIAKYIKENL